LYAVERLPGLNYYAVEVSGIPHPLRLHDGNLLKGGSQDSACMAVAMNVLAEGEEAVMLNAPYIEQQISEQLQRL
jgi:chemosensory pili system protein ChpC